MFENILARIKGIQTSPKYPTSTFLYYLEIDLINKYDKILHLKEEFWKLKSWINWLQDGDENTNSFTYQPSNVEDIIASLS